ncbi:autotransporter-associated beta strand repeat-containing protein [Ferruginibacter albus]|uniref:autotransporter-associated beta strand repeat-containing protein n=1 Tax=Ferruginibacter albus TaxID=2875540 RepID=UPI001CC70044|nr:autotransporter-associated beta strand repeat-containing protein [Ferruginibacter albus]UAY51599.1 autotransporter-associated beta strand repeat-containing protein [Ferruginibacter albus]
MTALILFISILPGIALLCRHSYIPVFILSPILFFSVNSSAQTTLSYSHNSGYYSNYVDGTAGIFTQTANVQIGQYANTSGNKRIFSYRKFQTAGDNTGTNRSLQVGDSVIIAGSFCRAYGKIGMSLLCSPAAISVGTTWADRENNYALSVYIDGPTNTGNGTYSNWNVKGASTQTASFGGNQGTYHDFIFTFKLNAPDRMNVYVKDNTLGSTSSFYDVQLNNSNPITDFSIYLQDDYDGSANRNAYWGLTGVSNMSVTNTGTSTLGYGNSAFTESNVIANGFAANSIVTSSTNTFTKIGTGTITLSGANTYSGATTVSNGALLITGSTNASSAITVAAGATLGGTGAPTGTVSLSGNVAPGTSAGTNGTLSTGALTINAASTYNFDITNVSGTAGTNWDYVNSSGAITVNSTSGSPCTIYVVGNPTGFSSCSNYTWKIGTGISISGFSANKFFINTTGFSTSFGGTFSITQSGNDINLVYTAALATPTVSVSLTTGTNPACSGTSLTYTATASNVGGGTVTYNFLKNGGSVQTGTSNTYTNATLANNDQIQCNISISGGTCLSSSTANSNTITQGIDAAPTASNAGSNQTIGNCATTLSANNPSIGTGTWSVQSGMSALSTQFANVNTYNTTFTPAGGAGNYVLQWSIANGSCTASTSTVTITVQSGTIWTGASSSDWNVAGNWSCGSIPTSATDVTIPSGTINSPNITSANANCKNITINNGATLTLANYYKLTVAATGIFTNNGTFTAGNGAVTFAGTGTIAGSNSSTFYNLIINGTTTLTKAPIVTDSLQLNNSSSVNTNSPVYGSSSTLVYNINGAYTVNTEWTGNATTAGSGIPKDVIIQNNSVVTMPVGNRGLAGNLFINSGTLKLNGTGNDLYIAGNWTRASSATFTPNNSAVYMNGSAPQTISVTGGGTETFNYLRLTGTGSFVQSSSPATNITVNSNGGLTLGGGSLNINGQTFTVSGGGNLSLSTGTRTIISSVAGASFIASGSALTVTNGGTLSFDVNTTVKLSTSIDFANNATTINGILQLNNNGTVNNNPPKYANTSLLQYNSGSNTHNRGAEWNQSTGTVGTTAGYPYDIQVTNGTQLNVPNGTTLPALGIAHNLIIDNSAAFFMDYGSPATSNAITVGNDVLVNGDLSLGFGNGGDLYIGGNYTVAASITPNNNGRRIFFNNASNATQVITKTGGGTVYFDYIGISQPSGSTGKVQLSSSPATNIQINSSANNTSARQVRLEGGSLDLNGQTFTLNGTVANSTNIGVYNGTRNIISSAGAGTLNITGTPALGQPNLVVYPSASRVQIATNVTVRTSVGCDLDSMNFDGAFQLDQYGFVINSSPIYGPTSTLIYNNTASFNRNYEWTASSGTIDYTPGYPNDVIIQNNTLLHYGLSIVSSGNKVSRATRGNLTIQSGSSLDMDSTRYPLLVGKSVNINGALILSDSAGGDIKIGENWNRSSTGTWSSNDRAVYLDSSLTGTITASGGENFPYLYLLKNSVGNTVSLNDSVAITKKLGLYRGALDLVNKNLTIVSNRFATAVIDTTITSSNVSLPYSGSGRFYIERFISNDSSNDHSTTNVGQRGWNLLSTAQVTSTQTINEAWQEGAVSNANTVTGIVNPVAGYGTVITGPNKAGNISLGFDPGTQNNESIKYMNSAGTAWILPPNTKSTSINTAVGYLIFVRGNRTFIVGDQYKRTDTTTLRIKGKINVGDYSFNPAAASYQVVGNPYAAEINLSNLFNSNNPTIGSTYYAWDPLLNGTNLVGAYVTANFTAPNTWYYNIGVTSPAGMMPGKIESGQAFILKFLTTGSVAFHETDKTSVNGNLIFRPAQPPGLFGVLLNKTTAWGQKILSDGALQILGSTFSNLPSYTEDSKKLTSPGENICLTINGTTWAIDKRQDYTLFDTVFYKLNNLSKDIPYQLAFYNSNISNSLQPVLQDLYTGSNTLIKLSSDTTYYNFTITSDSLSSNPNRFRIVFSSALPGNALPVTFTSVAAHKVNNSIEVNWKTSQEINIIKYEIEHSDDGKSFTSIGQINATNLQSYSWLDEKIVSQSNYYRIKSIDATGKTSYSETVKVDIEQASSISVFPNPVTDKSIHLYMNNQPQGLYTICLFDMSGRLVFQNKISVSNHQSLYKLSITKTMTTGLYKMEIGNIGIADKYINVLIK